LTLPLTSVPTPRPPPSTLFPYTTLFRSTVMPNSPPPPPPPPPGQGSLSGWIWDDANHDGIQNNAEVSFGTAVHIFLLDINGNTVDRKSTRLNSSHLVISYAVFCLKKKQT